MLLPSFAAQLNIDPTQNIVLGFGMRLRRPALQDLNPFIDDRDHLKIMQ